MATDGDTTSEIRRGALGEMSGRVAYGFRLDLLPEASDGMSWQKIELFSVGDELLTNPGSKRWRSKRVVLL